MEIFLILLGFIPGVFVGIVVDKLIFSQNKIEKK